MGPGLRSGQGFHHQNDVGVCDDQAPWTILSRRALQARAAREDAGDDDVVVGDPGLDQISHRERTAGKPGEDVRLTHILPRLDCGRRPRDPQDLSRHRGCAYDDNLIPGVMSGTSTVAGTSARSCSGVPVNTGNVPKWPAITCLIPSSRTACAAWRGPIVK